MTVGNVLRGHENPVINPETSMVERQGTEKLVLRVKVFRSDVRVCEIRSKP